MINVPRITRHNELNMNMYSQREKTQPSCLFYMQRALSPKLKVNRNTVVPTTECPVSIRTRENQMNKGIARIFLHVFLHSEF